MNYPTTPRQKTISEYYMLGPKIELIWTEDLIKKYSSRRSRDKIAFKIFEYIDRHYFYDLTDFPSSMKEHFRKLDYFHYLFSERPVFTIEEYNEVFLIKFLEVGEGNQYRLEINLTGSNIVKLRNQGWKSFSYWLGSN